MQEETDSEVNMWIYSKPELSLIAVCRKLCRELFTLHSLHCIINPIIKHKQAILRVESNKCSKCSPEQQKASRDPMSHPIISMWVRTYVAHAKRSLHACCSWWRLPGSSSMAWGCIFLAWFRFTEPLRDKDRCQHRAVLTEHVQPMEKQYVQSVFRMIWNHMLTHHTGVLHYFKINRH